ncbi:MAG: cytochrome-c peroxidase [Myxococcota bacterium]
MLLILLSCQPQKESTPFLAHEAEYLNSLIPMAVELDETNSLSGQSEAVTFGEILFFEHDISPAGVSCANCHDPSHAFSDPLPLSVGVDNTQRHAPSLWGSGYQRWLNWDGSCDTLWCQAIGPIEKSNEMGSTRTRLAIVISETERLKNKYESLFGPLPETDHWPLDAMPSETNDTHNAAWMSMAEADQQAATEVMVNIAKSIGAFEATLIPPPAPIDELSALYQADPQAAADWLDATSRRGLDLFSGEGHCSSCHLGLFGSNLEFHNIGLPLSETQDTEDYGRYTGIEMLRENPFNSAGIYSDAPSGTKANVIDQLVQSTEQLGQFKVPHLRELARSAPYMHSGQFQSLNETILHYSEMNDVPLQGHIEDFLVPLDWPEEDIEAVISFLMLFSEDGPTSN